MKRISARLRMLGGLAALLTVIGTTVTVTAPAQAASNEYGAIVISPVKKIAILQLGDSKAAVESAAMSKCKAEGGSTNCVELEWFFHSWGDLAMSANGHIGWDYAWDTSSSATAQQEAHDGAISGCRNVAKTSCHIVLEQATAGIPGTGTGGWGPYFKSNGAANFYYAALGDSYSSGLGNPPYPYNKQCSESAKAYPALLDAGVPTLGKLGFIACAGAVTDDFFAGKSTASQLSQLGKLPNVLSVTLTIGGNDIGFGPVITTCAELAALGHCKSSQEKAVDAALAALAGKGKGTTNDKNKRTIHAVATVLEAVHAKAPKARIFIAGYPRLFGTNVKDYTLLAKGHKGPGTYVCYIPDPKFKVTGYVHYDDAQWFDQTADTLNGILASAVTAAKRHGVPATFVSVRAAFSTHGDCDSGASWLTPLDPANAGATLHPTAQGQLAYEKGFLAAEGI